MQVTIRYFAYLREKRGLAVEQIIVDTPMRIDELFRKIFGEIPTGVRFAVHQEFVEPSYRLEDGDEVGFLPPVGGG